MNILVFSFNFIKILLFFGKALDKTRFGGIITTVSRG